MGAPWIVHEGYVLVRPPPHSSSTTSPDALERDSSPTLQALAAHFPHTASQPPQLVECYAVIYMNRKLELFDAATITPSTTDSTTATEPSSARRRIGDPLYVHAFAGWDGDGLLRVGDAYGLELKVDPKPHGSGRRTTSLFVAAFNRVDLDKLCRALVAALDPESAAGDDVRRERRRERKEAKRLALERNEKLAQWRQRQQQALDDARDLALARELEITNMTPLERVDGLGSLDDATAKLLEKRKMRLQKRHAPTTGRMNKTAMRKRMDDGAGGKVENVQRLQPKVVEPKARVRIELPLPGQFIEATGVSATHRIGLPTHYHRSSPSSSSHHPHGLTSSSSGSSSRDTPSDTSSVSSTTYPPPPPPPPPQSLLRMIQQPPPPPPRSTSASSSNFVDLHHRTDQVEEDDDDKWDQQSNASFASTRRRVSGVDQSKMHAHDSLAAILSGRAPAAAAGGGRRDSTASISSTNNRKQNANAFAASLAAIRRTRAETIEDAAAASVTSQSSTKRRDRTRASQLSAEGKELLQQAMVEPTNTRRNNTPHDNRTTIRKGLFDDSDDDSDDASDDVHNSSSSRLRSSRNRSDPTTRRSQAISDDASDDASDTTDASRSERMALHTFAASSTASGTSTPPHLPFQSAAASSSSPVVSVTFVASELRPERFGTLTKPAGVYTFVVRIDALEQSISHSFKALEALHEQLTGTFASAHLPALPSKHRLRNNTKPANMHKRGMELQAYLTQLFAVLQSLQHAPLTFVWAALGLDDAFVAAMRGERSSERAKDANSSTRTRKPLPRVATSPVESRSRRNSSSAGRKQQQPPATTLHLFGMASDDSDSASDSDDRNDPRASTVRPSATSHANAKARKASTRSVVHTTFEQAPTATTTRRNRPSSTASHASTASVAASKSKPTTQLMPPPASAPLRPNPFGGGIGGDLLAAIRQGAALKKVDPTGSTASSSSPAHPSARVKTPAAAAPTVSISDAISNAMASRRIHIEYEDPASDDDDNGNSDDSDDDWD